jgi:transposase
MKVGEGGRVVLVHVLVATGANRDGHREILGVDVTSAEDGAGWLGFALANRMVTEVRQRVTRSLLGRRGTVRDQIWVNRRLLLTGAEHLSSKQRKRLWRSLDTSDPTKEIQAAWAVKERLPLLLAEHEPWKIRWRLADFYEAAIDAQLPEATRLAGTIQTWWPAILTALLEDVDNARSEGGSTGSSSKPSGSDATTAT